MATRVLHVLASNDRRGAEVFAIDLAEALTAHGYESTVVAVAASRSTTTVDARPLGRRLGIGVIRRLRRLAREHDVVIAHGSTALPASALACAGVVPFIYRSIGDPAYWSARGLRRRRSSMFLRRACTIVTLWGGAANTLRDRGFDPDRLAVVPNGVRPGCFPLITPDVRQSARQRLGLPADARVVLYLGALSQEKRPDRAVHLGASRPALTVLLIGDGPESSAIGSAAAGLENVRVEGPTPEPGRYLAAADVVIVPSDTEGVPAVAIEAGLSGLPVVASDVGGLASVIEDGSTGYLVQPGDDAALARGVDAALAVGTVMGSRARAHCLQYFDIATVAQSWADVIDDVARPTTGT